MTSRGVDRPAAGSPAGDPGGDRSGRVRSGQRLQARCQRARPGRRRQPSRVQTVIDRQHPHAAEEPRRGRPHQSRIAIRDWDDEHAQACRSF